MTRVCLLLLTVLLVAPLVVKSLKCRQCGTYTCQPLERACKFGQTTDVCNCCPACAKGPGEVCGGAWNMAGKCQQGLQCVTPASSQENPNAQGACAAPSE